ncbi:MAG: hypothetical protein ACTSRA_13940 [Promethearchaeota archaeon]
MPLLEKIKKVVKIVGKQGEDRASTESTRDLWDQIGFHKTLAGFWYNLVYTLIAIILSMFFMGYLMNVFYPYPESVGYKDIAFTTFSLMFVAFDLGTANIMDRFIGEKNIKDPGKMLKYVQYFIWYQMMTGLAQLTIVSAYALYFAEESNLGYAVWIMLIVATTQYPGFLGVFRNVLGSLQYYNKVQTLNFLGNTIIQRATELTFILIGRFYGAAHVEVGEMLGIAIGSAIGLYVDDFITMLISAKFFSDAMKIYGIRPIDCLKPNFSWADIKPVFIFALKTGVPGLIGPAMNLINLFLWLTYVPHYSTFLMLSSIGGSIAGIMDWFGTPSITALISESYLNNKNRLSQYYIGQIVRFHTLLKGFFIPIIIVISTVMPIAWVALGMNNYLLASPFIIPTMIVLAFNSFAGIPGQVLYGANRPNFAVITGFINTIANTVMIYLYLAVLRIPDIYGFTGFVFVYKLGGLPISLFFVSISYIYIDRKLMKIKIPWKQIIIGIALPSFITFILTWIGKTLVFDTLYGMNVNFFLTAVISILMIGFIMIFCYFPLTMILGGWDRVNLEEFRKTAQMSGPSKLIVQPLYRMLKSASQKSPLHDKFGMKMEEVIQDALDLLEIKRTNRALLRKELQE